MIDILRSFKRDERGAPTIEYGLIAALIFLSIVTAVTLVANRMVEKFDTISNAVSSTM